MAEFLIVAGIIVGLLGMLALTASRDRFGNAPSFVYALLLAAIVLVGAGLVTLPGGA